MDNIKKGVIDLLKSYPIKKRQIEQLQYELAHPPLISERELIDSQSYGEHILGNSVPKHHISDKTMLVAMQYQDTAQKMNRESAAQIARELQILENEVARLEHYVSLLGRLQSQIIQLYYFEGKPWGEIEEELHMTKKTLSSHRDKGLLALAAMYHFVSDFESVL